MKRWLEALGQELKGCQSGLRHTEVCPEVLLFKIYTTVWSAVIFMSCKGSCDEHVDSEDRMVAICTHS